MNSYNDNRLLFKYDSRNLGEIIFLKFELMCKIFKNSEKPYKYCQKIKNITIFIIILIIIQYCYYYKKYKIKLYTRLAVFWVVL